MDGPVLVRRNGRLQWGSGSPIAEGEGVFIPAAATKDDAAMSLVFAVIITFMLTLVMLIYLSCSEPIYLPATCEYQNCTIQANNLLGNDVIVNVTLVLDNIRSHVSFGTAPARAPFICGVKSGACFSETDGNYHPLGRLVLEKTYKRSTLRKFMYFLVGIPVTLAAITWLLYSTCTVRAAHLHWGVNAKLD